MSFGVIHTHDPRMQKTLDIVDNIATSKAAVLIRGESGTGKELMARYIHAKSSRSSGKFVAINCAAVPENLLESELFGHERGAFTGAEQRKIGRFEVAHGGTLLLDEIGELPLPLQSKLLRVIQESEIERLGGIQPIKIDVRIIAATNRDLAEMVNRNEFREDLYYRLNVIPLEIPSLRSRPKDIELLSRMFLKVSCEKNGIPEKSLTAGAMKKLSMWKWPGNVRELQNVIERSVLLSKAINIDEEDLYIENFKTVESERSLRPGMTVSEAEKLLILKTLEHTRENRTQAAQLLGISIRTLRNKIREYKEAGLNE